jgi:hydrogenase maturation protease
MSFEAAERIARALLFEGYLLYPYRASSRKNQQRWAFGTLYPKPFCVAADAGDASSTRTECLVEGEAPRVRVVVKFLRRVSRAERGAIENVSDEAIERSLETGELALDGLAAGAEHFEWHVPASRAVESNTERVGEPLSVRVVASAEALAPAVWKLSVSIDNDSDAGPDPGDRRGAEQRALGSVHTLLECRAGRFASQLDPPARLRPYADRCKSAGSFPVLVGAATSSDTMLSSPIILEDHPRIAPASPGDLFDATEIDEILSLRILTLSDAEREEVARTDPRARALLERTEALGEDALLALHGVCSLAAADGVPASGARSSRAFAPGDRVVLRPGRGGEALVIVLSGHAATVIGVEEDVEGRVYYTVTVDADPGRDLGALGKPGHRFFFTEAELERAT